MDSIKEWADFYRKMRVWVFPYNIGDTSMSYWKYWRNIAEPEYLEMYEGYKWDNVEGIKLVVGKKGVRVLVLHGMENEKSRMECLYRVLSILKLPDDYPWIIEIGSTYAIIVDTPSDVMGMGNRTYVECLLLWEGSFVLPSPSNGRRYYKDRLPQSHPIQIPNEVLFSCINNLRNGFVYKVKEDITMQTTEEVIDEASKRIKGLTYEYDDFFRNFLHVGLIIWFFLVGGSCLYFIPSVFVAFFIWILIGVIVYYATVLILKNCKDRAIEKYINEFPEDEVVGKMYNENK